AVALLWTSEDQYSRRSLRLLKVLTVLAEGETIQSIRRFYPAEPFYLDNVNELVRLSLLDAVPISQTTADIRLHLDRNASLGVGTPKLLRVPRQVRDYVRSLMTDDERSEIIHTATELLFGRKWREG